MKYLIAIVLLASSPCWGAYARVQNKACSAAATTDACQFTSGVTTTDLIIATCFSNQLTACLRVTDDQSNAYRLINSTLTTAAASGGTLVWGIWYATASAAGLTTVTCNDPCANGTWIEQSISEYSGNMYLTNPFDVYSDSSSSVSITTTTSTAPPISPTRNGELIFSVVPQIPSAATAANGTIETNTVDNTFWATESFIQSAAAVYQSSFTFASGTYVNKISQASFKAPISAPTGVETWQ